MKKNSSASFASSAVKRAPAVKKLSRAQIVSRAGSVSTVAKARAARRNGAAGGRPREFPKCKRYRAHVFSPTTGRCPCGFVRRPLQS